MARIAGAVPTTGAILDIGCGHGVLAYHLAAGPGDSSVLAIDPSAAKIAEAGRARFPASRVSFRQAGYAEVQERAFDVIVFVDVLYLLPPDVQRDALRWCVERLAPTGMLLVKEQGDRPRWKFWFNYLEETLAVRVLGITLGQRLCFQPTADFTDYLTSLGFEVKVTRIDRGYLHPHVLFTCRKRSS
ncbi:MAG: class I SAM-dependent methyltransferase [Gemmatimonadales bacterium]